MSRASRLAALILALAPGAAAARSTVVVVVSDELEAYRVPTEAFLAELGQQPRVYNLHGRAPEAAVVMAQVKLDAPEVLFCVGAKAYACKNGAPDTTVVYAAVLDPERYGVVGEHVTGVTMDIDPVTYLSQFAGFFPEVRTIGVIRGPDRPEARLDQIGAAAAELDRALVVRAVDRPDQVRRTLVDLAKSGVDALWVPPDRAALTTGSYRTIAEEARRRHLPLLVDTASMVEAGGLFAMVPDPEAMGRQAAVLVNTILAGGEIPAPQAPEEVLVVLNARTLEMAELPFDRMLLDFVDRVVE